MANSIQIIITAKDEATKVLEALSGTQKRVAASVKQTQAELGKLDSSTKANSGSTQTLSRQLDIAKQRLLEASQAGNVKKSTMMALQNTVANYEARIAKVNAKEQAAANSTRGMTGAVLAGSAAYAALGNTLGRVQAFMSSSIESANRYQSALIGLSSVARAFGQDQEAAKKAAQSLAKDGLMTVADSATGLKNLLATGFSLDQAVNLMNAFKNSAAFGKQAALGFGESIRGATEGIKNGNSILTDNAGVTKNLSVILTEAGKSQQDVMNITTDASVRQALYNGILKETSAQTGDAARLTQTYAGEQARASAQTETFKQTVGALEQAVGGGLLQAFTSFIGTNQTAIISIGAGTLAAVGFAGGLFLVVKAIQAFSLQSLIAAASNPLIMALTVLAVLAGIVVYKAVDKMQAKIAESNKHLGDMGGALGKVMPAQAAKADKALADLAKQLSTIDAQIVKAERDFRESLAQMVKDHEDKVIQLKSQLADEDAAFKKSADRKAADFEASQKDMLDSHQKRTDKLEQDLNGELALGKWADRQKVRDLQDQLATENAEYDKQAADKQAAYDQDVADAKETHDKKLTDLQDQLATENALLSQHAADVAGIRGVMLLDQIDNLKRSHDEQLQAFEQQKNDAIQKSGEATAGVAANYDNLVAQLAANTGPMNAAGGALGKAFVDAIKSSIQELFTKDIPKAVTNFSKDWKNWADVLLKTNPGTAGAKAIMDALGQNPFRAEGGPVSGNTPYIVGEQGPELFVPHSSGTIVPAGQTSSMMGAGVNFSQINHIYNQVDMEAANRALGWRLATRAG